MNNKASMMSDWIEEHPEEYEGFKAYTREYQRRRSAKARKAIGLKDELQKRISELLMAGKNAEAEELKRLRETL
jgi:hypothetical protein